MIIASPRDMRSFAADLARLSGRMQEWQEQLDRERASLKAVWDDKRYEEFNSMVGHAQTQLDIFHAQAKRYVIYLEAKADAGQRYLNR